MNKNVLIVLAGGFVVAILVAVLVQASLGGSKKADDGSVPKSQVLVAAKNLSLGTNLAEGDLKWQSWPGSPFQGAIVRKGEEKALDALNGRLIQKVSEGQPVLRNAVFKEGRGNLVAATLGAGMRAISIPVKAQNMAGGFVKPGDYVDVVMTYRVRMTGNTARAASSLVNRYATETIIKNARVLGVDQEPKAEGDDKGKVGKTVTIEVSSQDAEKVALGQEMGKLTLALRGIGDKDDQNKDATTTDVQLSNVMQNVVDLNENIGDGKKGLIRVYSGANMQEVQPRSIRSATKVNATSGDLGMEVEQSEEEGEGLTNVELGKALLDAIIDGSVSMDMLQEMRSFSESVDELESVDSEPEGVQE